MKRFSAPSSVPDARPMWRSTLEGVLRNPLAGVFVILVAIFAVSAVL